MKKYSEADLTYFNIGSQKLLNGEELEQRMDEEDLDGEQENAAQNTDACASAREKRNGRNNAEPESSKTRPATDTALIQLLLKVKAGEKLQTNTDTWVNGIMLPANTPLDVTTAPKKVRSNRKTECGESSGSIYYLVHCSALLETGNQIEVRLNLDCCKFPSVKNQSSPDDALKW